MSRPNEALIQSIVNSISHHGPTAMFIAMPLDDWFDVIDSISFCLEQEDLTPDERGHLESIFKSLSSKAKRHEARLAKG